MKTSRPQLKKLFKRITLHACKWTGCFQLARHFTRRAVRILGYHGFSLRDEANFRTPLFMDADEFHKRIEYLSNHGYPIISLDQAIGGLRTSSLPDCATVITFDDGFYSTWKLAIPILLKKNLPSTIYVTTYYSVKNSPVFRLVIQYMFWKTTKKHVEPNALGFTGSSTVTLSNHEAAHELMWKLIERGEQEISEERRVILSRKVGEQLGVKYSEIVNDRFLNVMTTDEVLQAYASGIDIQLHTHRHRMPRDLAQVKKELADNRSVLEPLLGCKLHHFCYPSGVYHPDHWPTLQDAGVVSATTCDRGLNYHDTFPLALNRFLDADNISWIEFEAEMCGLIDCFRMMRRRLRALTDRFSSKDSCGVPRLV